jgi:NDP-sugar pyrophosphorylase family protein
MILAAGLGTRMRPLTANRPKALIELAGHALIEFPLVAMVQAGIHRIVVNLHYFGDQIRDYLGDGSKWGAAIEYSPEPVLQGSGGGIRAARALLGTGTIVTMNADTVVGIDLRPYLDEHRRHAAAATLVLRRDPEMERFGTLGITADGRIGRFLAHRAPQVPDPLEAYMFTGVQILEPLVFRYMTDPGPFSITESVYPRMLASGESLFGAVFDGPWLTVGTPDELIEAGEVIEKRSFDWPAWMELS